MPDRNPDITIEIDDLPPSKNVWSRLHWSRQRRIFANWYELVAFHPKRREWPKLKGRVTVEVQFHFPDRRVRDTQNLIGFPPLFDALINKGGGIGVIEDDRSDKMSLQVPAPIVDGTRRTVIRIWREM
jgi:hypothetical protein